MPSAIAHPSISAAKDRVSYVLLSTKVCVYSSPPIFLCIPVLISTVVALNASLAQVCPASYRMNRTTKRSFRSVLRSFSSTISCQTKDKWILLLAAAELQVIQGAITRHRFPSDITPTPTSPRYSKTRFFRCRDLCQR